MPKKQPVDLSASRYQYAALKSRYPNVVLLLNVAAGLWLARWTDADHVLAVHPTATMLPGDGVTVEDRHVDAIVAALKAAGQTVALAEPVSEVPAGADVEYIQSPFDLLERE